MCVLYVSAPHQNHFLCLAVLNGRLRLFFDFADKLDELMPKEPMSDDLKVSDADPKAVSIMSFCLSVCLSYML